MAINLSTELLTAIGVKIDGEPFPIKAGSFKFKLAIPKVQVNSLGGKSGQPVQSIGQDRTEIVGIASFHLPSFDGLASQITAWGNTPGQHTIEAISGEVKKPIAVFNLASISGEEEIEYTQDGGAETAWKSVLVTPT